MVARYIHLYNEPLRTPLKMPEVLCGERSAGAAVQSVAPAVFVERKVFVQCLQKCSYKLKYLEMFAEVSVN